MTILVTGGAGFLGTRLIAHLLADQPGRAPVSRVLCVDRVPSPLDDPRVESVLGDIGEAAFGRGVVRPDVTAIWHLAAVLSGQSEAEPDLAMVVNVAGTQALLDGCRSLSRPPRFVFSSTVAVFGGPLPAIVPEDFALRPQSTYGASKAIAELLVLEACRRGVIDAVVCRVPTVSVRPGRPNSALSSFVSGIIREPLAGIESVCPVALDTPLWVSSPDTTTANLARAGRLDTAPLGEVRTVNLPGLTLTPGQMLDSLERAAGAATRALVRVEPDAHIGRMVRSWPGAFDVTRALALGFTTDRDADALVAQFIDGAAVRGV
jgi:nucleoside-diphosphate-sugar epimerase